MKILIQFCSTTTTTKTTTNNSVTNKKMNKTKIKIMKKWLPTFSKVYGAKLPISNFKVMMMMINVQ